MTTIFVSTCLFSCLVLLNVSNVMGQDVNTEKRTLDGTTKIVVIRKEARLYLYEHDQLIKTYRVSIGNAKMGKATPTGRFVIMSKVKNPSMMWRSGKYIPPNDPRNSYGARWMGFARYTTRKYRGYGIQGTNVESSIGKQITVGSIQMHNNDIVELFDRVTLGTEVIVR